MSAHVHKTPLERLGRHALGRLESLGGMGQVMWRSSRAIMRMRWDTDEAWRALYAFGNASLPIALVTAAFVGMIMVLQAAVYVQEYGVYDLVGWYTGYATLREVGPILIGLMFSGRVGASHCSELATMRTQEQLDALRVLAIDVYEALIAPRALAMVISMAILVILADAMAIASGALGARVLLGVDAAVFWSSFTERLAPMDFVGGLAKAVAFGWVIAMVATHFGLRARGGAPGVGAAVNAQVVASAVGLFCADYLMTVGLL